MKWFKALLCISWILLNNINPQSWPIKIKFNTKIHLNYWLNQRTNLYQTSNHPKRSIFPGPQEQQIIWRFWKPNWNFLTQDLRWGSSSQSVSNSLKIWFNLSRNANTKKFQGLSYTLLIIMEDYTIPKLGLSWTPMGSNQKYRTFKWIRRIK